MAKDFGYNKGDFITEEEKYDILDQLPEEHFDLDEDDENRFVVKEGAEALEAMLADLDLDEMAFNLRQEVKEETSQMRKKEKLKQLQSLNHFEQQLNTLKTAQNGWFRELSPLFRLN